MLKNAIDWGARPYGKNSWAGKPAFITGTSPGAIGSALAQQHLRSVMVSLGVILLGGEAYVTFKPNSSTTRATSPTKARGSFSKASSIGSQPWSERLTSPATSAALGGVAAGELTSPPVRG